jgi:O-antigen/teichoic acid export membrane protein
MSSTPPDATPRGPEDAPGAVRRPDRPALSARLRRGARLGSLAATAFLAQSLSQISSFIMVLLAARFLAPAEFGIYSLATAITLLLQTLTYTGVYHFIIRDKAEEDVLLGTTFWMMTGFAVLGAVVLMLASPLFVIGFGAPQLGPAITLLAFNQILLGPVGWITAVLFRQQKLRVHYTIMIVQNVIGLVAGVALLASWKSFYALIAVRIIQTVIAGLLYFGHTRMLPPRRFDRPLAREALSFAGGLYGTKLLAFLGQNLATFLLGAFYSVTEIGLYRFGSRLAQAALAILIMPFTNFATTQFGAANRADQSFTPLLRRFNSTALLMLGMASVCLIVFAERLVGAFFQPAYMEATTVTIAVAIGQLFTAGSMFLAPALAAAGRTGVLLKYRAMVLPINLVAICIAAPFGINALAWTLAVTSLATSIAALIVMARTVDIKLGPIVRDSVTIGALLAGFWVALELLVRGVDRTFPNEIVSLGAGVLVAMTLGVVLLGIGVWRQLFHLRVFSG